MDLQKPNPSLPTQPQDRFTHSGEQSRLVVPQYEVPYIVSYTDQDILEQLGPALTGTGSRLR